MIFFLSCFYNFLVTNCNLRYDAASFNYFKIFLIILTQCNLLFALLKIVYFKTRLKRHKFVSVLNKTIILFIET